MEANLNFTTYQPVNNTNSQKPVGTSSGSEEIVRNLLKASAERKRLTEEANQIMENTYSIIKDSISPKELVSSLTIILSESKSLVDNNSELGNKTLSLVNETVAFLSEVPKLTDHEINQYGNSFNDHAMELITAANGNPNDTTHYTSVMNILYVLQLLTVGMMTLLSDVAKVQSQASDMYNKLLKNLGELNQFAALVSSIEKSALNDKNKQEAKDKTSLSSQITWQDAMKYQGDGWKGDKDGNLIIDGNDLPDLLKQVAQKSDDGKSYIVSVQDVQNAILKVSQEVQAVMPTDSDTSNPTISNSGTLSDTYKTAFENSGTNDAFSGAITNEIKAANDKLSAISSQISVEQQTIQTLLNDQVQKQGLSDQTWNKI